MNRNLQNKFLSEAELVDIAVDNGLIDRTKIEGMKADLRSKFRSKLLSITGKTRFSMWSRGELILNTNPKE